MRLANSLTLISLEEQRLVFDTLRRRFGAISSSDILVCFNTPPFTLLESVYYYEREMTTILKNKQFTFSLLIVETGDV